MKTKILQHKAGKERKRDKRELKKNVLKTKTRERGKVKSGEHLGRKEYRKFIRNGSGD